MPIHHNSLWVALCLVLVAAGCGGTTATPDSGDTLDADAGSDADQPADGDPTPDAGGDSRDGEDADAGDTPDAGDGEDGGSDGSDAGDTGPDGGEDAGCGDIEPFDYRCEAGVPETCPDGICLMGMCIAAVLDPDRWADCGDGACGPCEREDTCPADCGTPPVIIGAKEYDNATTLTVWAHGFYNKSPDEMAEMVYGENQGCSGIIGEFARFGIVRPCGATPPGDTAPDQLCKVEYYGGVPAPWLTPADVAEIEQFPYDGPDALERYARILAKFVRHKLDVSGATHVNLACHSMGCLITRHMLEHDLEGLASEGRFVRWFTSAGVIAGARLARLYDNPQVQEWAPLLGLELNDFVIMHPDFVQDYTCRWDHRLHEGNNPLLSGMIIHHAGATDPHVQQALGLTLLDLDNPGDEPNDGIMYTADEYFHDQAPGVVFHAPDGTPVPPSLSLAYFDHMNLPDSDAAALLATADLFHRRKVLLTIRELTLYLDRENHEPFDGEHGEPPAEIAAEVEVRYNPYVLDTFGKDVLVHEAKIDQRAPEVFPQDQGSTLDPQLLLFDGPVFDDMTELHLDFEILEVDWYPRFGVREWTLDAHQRLLSFTGQIPLVDDTLEFENEYARVRLEVRVVDQY